jgi:hypothetical protein
MASKLIVAIGCGVAALQASAAEPERACPPNNTESYKVFWSQADGNSKAQAMTTAMEASRQRAIEQLCAGLAPGSTKCTSRQAALESWSSAAEGKGRRWQTCVAWGVRKEALPDIDAQSDALDEQLDKVAARVAELVKALRLNHPILTVRPPTWGSNCPIGRGGDAIKARLGRALGERGVKPAPISMYDRGPALYTELAIDGANAWLSFYFVASRSAAPETIVTIEAPRAVLRVSDKDEERCMGNQRLGLNRGERLGSAELGVQLTLDVAKRSFCDGDTFNMQVTTTKVSRVRVYSVDKEGHAWQVFPWKLEQSDVVRPDVLLRWEGAAAPARGGGDETLVAVAVPETGDLGELGRGGAFCKVPGVFGSHLYPQGAAVGSTAFRVLAQGAAACADDGQRFERMDRVRELMAAVEPCW